MRIVSVLIIFIITIGMVGCRPSCDPKDLEKQKLANEVRRKAAAKVKQETDLHPCGTIGQMLCKVEVLGLSFQYYKPTDIVEGRKLLIQSINSLMEEVNQEKKIHPFLSNYPFQPNNIEIQIFLYSPDRGDAPQGSLSYVDAQDGVLRYDIKDPKTLGFTRVYQETYEEALERIKDPSLPLVPFHPDTKKISSEELAKLRKSISMVTDDGSILRLDAEGRWTKDSQNK